MTTLLHISASPRGDRSESLALAETFLAAYRDTHPDAEIQTWDLWDGSLPEFGPAAAHAKMAVFAGADPMGEQATAWRAAKDAFDRFAAADQYLFSVPMWNAGIPYILKQFIDVVSQPGMVFGFDAEARLHRSADRPEGRGRLHQRRLRAGPAAVIRVGLPGAVPAGLAELGGIDDITEVAFRPNLATADAEMGRQQAHAEARDAGKVF